MNEEDKVFQNGVQNEHTDSDADEEYEDILENEELAI